MPATYCASRAMDADGDSRLSLREMRNAWNRLAPFAKNGFIEKSNIPRQFRLTLSNGRPPGRNVPPGVGVGPEFRTMRPARGPRWFQKMDRNGDGDVSRAEFLGTEEQFKKLDADGDGLISLEEAERGDKWFRDQLRKRIP